VSKYAMKRRILQVTLANLASYAPRPIEWYVRKMAPINTLIIFPISRVEPSLKSEGEKGLHRMMLLADVMVVAGLAWIS
jgi:hypothetical protein